MLDQFFSLVYSTVEYRGWHLWNLATVGFLITVVFTFLLQLPGLINQARIIWRNRSAEGIEALTFIIFLTYFAVFLVYAFSNRSGAGIINGFVLIWPQVFILVGVIRFKKFRKIDLLISCLMFTILFLTVFTSHKSLFFAIISVITFFGLLLQPIEMIRKKTSTNVALSLPLNFTVVTLAWTIYGFAVRDWYIGLASLAFCLIYIFTTVLWFRYRQVGT